jgi:hypothetical protein
MKVEYRKSFERDLRGVRDQNLLNRVEASESLDSISNRQRGQQAKIRPNRSQESNTPKIQRVNLT